jgi:sec-independent protein translocase protein TatB
MFDLAWSEIAVIGLVAVLVLGPKELPNAMRTMAKVMRKMRNLTSELQGHINEVVREAELEEVRQSIQKLSSTNITAEVTKAVDPTGELSGELTAGTPPPATTTSDSAVTEIAPAEAAPEPAKPQTPSNPAAPT